MERRNPPAGVVPARLGRTTRPAAKVAGRMHSAKTAFRLCLVAMAAALAAAVAHVVIDVAGDYLLARDAYDGVAHSSRALVAALLGVAVLVAAARLVFDAIDRRCGSTTSLLRTIREALGSPARFAAASAAVAILALAAMEGFDCAAGGVRIDDLSDLFGGSLLLGLSAPVAAGLLFGWLLHRGVRALAEHEPALARFVLRVVSLTLAAAAPASSHRRIYAVVPATRGTSLARRGRKRGPPFATSG